MPACLRLAPFARRCRGVSARLVVVAIVATVAACGGGSGTSASSTTAAPAAPASAAADDTGLSPAAQLGRSIFADPSLSGSGKVACVSCHDPAFGHGSPFDAPVAPGGAALDQAGGRKPPSIRYLKFNAGFAVDADGTAHGGFFWDGRAGSLEEQAGGPFLNPAEMANDGVEAVIARLRATSYAARFAEVFGADVWNDPAVAFARVRSALAAYQREDEDFAPFSSRYDAFLAGRATLPDAALRGLALFVSPSKGNCAACHPSQRGSDGSAPLFTDFSFDALGVPRNPAIAKNADPAYHDLGLCGPTRTAPTALGDAACGRFKVPTLRNVALARRLFHNGRFTSLKDAVTFYATRDSDPARWYPIGPDGLPVRYDDLPAAHRGNVNRTEVPYGRSTPTLNDTEIDDIVAFLGTLTDGWQP